MTDYPKGDRADLESAHPAAEVLTDKAVAKVVPCVGCGRDLIVNSFYAPAIAKCSDCAETAKAAGVGQAEIVQPGRTDPSKAARLEDTLLNKALAFAVCPFDAGHEMELKSVSHNPNYGPSRIVGYEKSQPLYKNDVGESVTHQCNECKVTVSYSTVHQMVYRRQNEPKVTAGDPPSMEYLLGARSVA